MQHGPLRKCHYDQGPRWKLGTWLWLCLSYNLIYFCLVFVRNSARSRGMLRQCPCPYAYTGPWTGRSHWTSGFETKPKRALEIRSWLQANFLQGAHNLIFHQKIDCISVKFLMRFSCRCFCFFLSKETVGCLCQNTLLPTSSTELQPSGSHQSFQIGRI